MKNEKIQKIVDLLSDVATALDALADNAKQQKNAQKEEYNRVCSEILNTDAITSFTQTAKIEREQFYQSGKESAYLEAEVALRRAILSITINYLYEEDE